jgi:hypothetical protein
MIYIITAVSIIMVKETRIPVSSVSHWQNFSSEGWTLNS